MNEGKISILTIGDISVDQFLKINESDASLNCDINREHCKISFKYGEKIPVERYHFTFGGSALNTAVGFSRLGFETSIASITGIGKDADETLYFLEKENVKVDSCIKEGESNRSSIILLKGERTIFSYHAPRDYSKLKLPNAPWIYFASAAKGSDLLVPQVLDQIASGTKLVFNPGSWQLTNFEKFLPLVKGAIALILNKSEANMVIGEATPREQLKKMLALGARIAVITAGINGAYAASRDKFVHSSILAGQTIDSTGAGDSFACALISGLIYKQSLEEGLRWGMINSGSVVEKIGANEGLMKAGEIEAELAKTKNLKIIEI